MAFALLVGDIRCIGEQRILRIKLQTQSGHLHAVQVYGCVHAFVALNVMTLNLSSLPPVLGKRSPLPPDPSNTRLQGIYASIWQQSSPSTPSGPLARSQSSCERPPKTGVQYRTGSPWPWQHTCDNSRVGTAQVRGHHCASAYLVDFSPAILILQLQRCLRHTDKETLSLSVYVCNQAQSDLSSAAGHA